MQREQHQRLLYSTLTIGSAVGFAASFLQMLEKITLLKDSHAALSCNLNSVFSCSNVLNAHQSSLFGFPNALLCMSFFALMFTAGAIGWAGGTLPATIRFVYQGMAVFFLGFGFWYFWQSIFVIGSLCVYCLFCYAGVLAINAAWLRLNAGRLPGFADRLIAKGVDVFVWLVIALVIGAEALIGLR